MSSQKNIKKFVKKATGISVKNINHYTKAFTHKSIDQVNNNERLEFLGDAILSSVVAQHLFKKFPNKKEGELSQLLSTIVNRKKLNKIADEIGLLSFVHVADSKQKHKYLGGNTVEALIGAIYLDRGVNKAKKAIIQKLIIPHINYSKLEEKKIDPKSQAIIWGQKTNNQVTFESIEKEGLYHTMLLINGKKKTKAVHEQKKESEKKAAKKAIKRGVIKLDLE